MLRRSPIALCLVLLPSLTLADDQSLVREYLKENTNTGAFDEVRWYPIEKITADTLRAESAARDKEIAALRNKIKRHGNSKVLSAKLNKLLQEQSGSELAGIFGGAIRQNAGNPDRSIRLKFRTQNDLGSKTLCDWTFYFRGEKLVRVLDNGYRRF